MSERGPGMAPYCRAGWSEGRTEERGQAAVEVKLAPRAVQALVRPPGPAANALLDAQRLRRTGQPGPTGGAPGPPVHAAEEVGHRLVGGQAARRFAEQRLEVQRPNHGLLPQRQVTPLDRLG